MTILMLAYSSNALFILQIDAVDVCFLSYLVAIYKDISAFVWIESYVSWLMWAGGGSTYPCQASNPDHDNNHDCK
ncbi:hypothetical protein ACQKWADRAFT_304790 [Trichoderma austrokoningii]